MEIKTLNEQIERLRELIRKCYATVAGKNGTVPEVGERTMENLPTSISSIKHLEQADLDAAYDTFKVNTGMIPKEEQTIGNLKYAVAMNAEQMDANEINFVDFNGIVLSMTIEEVMQLTEMPKPNEYYNLTFEHWTKTLEEIQDGRCHTIGATYHTTDGCHYYIIETTEDNQSVEIVIGTTDGVVYWGDGNSDASAWSKTHVYEKKGRYTIKVDCHNSLLATRGGAEINSLLLEIYLGSSIIYNNVDFRNCENLRVVSFPDNNGNEVLRQNTFSGCRKIRSLVLGNTMTGSIKYLIQTNMASKFFKCFVADGMQGDFDYFRTMNDLECISIKNINKIGDSAGTYYYSKLKYLTLDNVTEIKQICNGAITNYLKVLDLPPTLVKIENNSFKMNVQDVYLRTLTPPTLGGTSVFWNSWWGYKTIIHIRKDATFTDANGDTWTGLEAYAHATNWASLYTNTNFTFIDDL